MKPLNDHVRKGGFDYYKVKEIPGKGYIYQQNDNGRTIAFEVFKHKENTQFNCVSFPSNEAFGSWAWSCRTLTEAENKLLKITQ